MTRPIRKLEHDVERAIRFQGLQFGETRRGRCECCRMPPRTAIGTVRRWAPRRIDGAYPVNYAIVRGPALCAVCVVRGTWRAMDARWKDWRAA